MPKSCLNVLPLCAFLLSIAFLTAAETLQIKDPSALALASAQKAGLPPRLREALIRIAGEEENRDRLRAVVAIGENRIGSPEAIKVLGAALKAQDAAIRSSAVWALGMTGKSEASAAVQGALKDSAPEVRAAACAALSELGVLDFTGLLQDPEEAVRLAAAEAVIWNPSRQKQPPLSAAGGERWGGALAKALQQEKSSLVQAALLQALPGSEFKNVVAFLRSSLKGSDLPVRLAALQFLSGVGADASSLSGDVRPFAAAANPAAVRIGALQALARLDPAWVQGNAAGWGAEANPALRAAAAEALGIAGDIKAVAELEKMFDDAEYTVRRTASAALMRLMDRQILTKDDLVKLAATAANADAPERAGCGLWLLGTLKSQAGFPGILKHASIDITKPAERVPVAALLMVVVAQTRYEGGGEAAVKFFSQDAGDENVRLQAIRAIGALQFKPAVAPVLKKLAAFKVVDKVPSWTLTGRLREETILALLATGGPEVVEGMLNDILSPKPVEDDALVALVCQWLADTKATAAAEDLDGAQGAKAFSDYVNKVLVWTHGRLTGKEASADVPPPPVSLTLPTFLSEQ